MCFQFLGSVNSQQIAEQAGVIKIKLGAFDDSFSKILKIGPIPLESKEGSFALIFSVKIV